MILGLALIPLLSQFYIGFQGNITAEIVTQATDLANDLMEEIKSRRFDENFFPDEPGSTLGIDSGENADNRASFDDVDDYNGWQRTPPQSIDATVLSDFSRFTRSAAIDYVRLNGATWVYSGTPTYYKRIIVTVSHPKIDDKKIETIVSHY
jgi:hypothetical protein